MFVEGNGEDESRDRHDHVFLIIDNQHGSL